MKEKVSYVMYKEWSDSFRKMSDKQLGCLMRAIFDYQDGKEVKIDDITAEVMFALIKQKFDTDSEKYADVCKRKAEGGRNRGNKDGEPNTLKDSSSNLKTLKDSSSNLKTLKDSLSNATDSDSDCVSDSECVSECVSDGVSDSGFEEEKSINSKEKQSKKKAAASAYVDDPELNAAIADFVEHRKKLRKPMTDKAISLFIKRVNELAISTQEQIELINTAIERGWQTVYPREEKARSGTTTGTDYLYQVATGGVL